MGRMVKHKHIPFKFMHYQLGGKDSLYSHYTHIHTYIYNIIMCNGINFDTINNSTSINNN